MSYVVPKFIEKEAKIVGPLNFKQFLMFLIAGAILLMLYFAIGKKSFFLFMCFALPILIIVLFLAFGKVKGRTLPVFLKNYFSHQSAPKVYYFQKKTFAPTILHFKIEKREKEEESTLKFKRRRPELHQLFTEVETKRED